MTRVDTQLVELSAETTSPVYITGPDYFVPYVRDPAKHLFVHREAADGVPGVVELTEVGELGRTDWTVDGFTLTGEFEYEEFEGEVSVPVERVLAETPLTREDFPLSFFKVVAVDPDQRSRGIGTQLTAKAIAPLFESPPVVAFIWLRDNPANQRLAEYYASGQVATFEDYFDEDWDCPDCGYENNCTCDVMVYGWFGDERDRAVAASNAGADVEAETETEGGAGVASH
ncbi:GNAT family N-acetyltransferase [Salinirubellus sp. GCM10025818]|uniref:GNAT family N-acetyltransferase n=1 Tax=Salinirubellus TaxID=2162630 RepID=UPI0030CED579